MIGKYEFDTFDMRSDAWAKIIVPMLFRTIGTPQSVVDLGGGHGYWLRAMQENGVRDVVCIEHPAMFKLYELPQDTFIPMNLEKELPDPVRSELAISIEFAEHVPPTMADPIVSFLTGSSPLVLFSAATPFQLGVGHVNGQWPDYWIRKFSKKGFKAYDILRPQLLFNNDLPFWLKTNIFLFAADSASSSIPGLQDYSPPWPNDINIIHSSALPEACPLAAYATKALVKETITRLAGLPIRMVRRLLGSN